MSGNFYAVFIPDETEEDVTQVFTDKTEAAKLFKKYKKSRLKSFDTFQEALKFTKNGPELFSFEPCDNKPQNEVAVEKTSSFKSLKSQELVQLRTLIESGNYKAFFNMIWENPRYLISSGDTPSILQEGFRYNALHVAVRARQVLICDQLLKTISSPHFIKHAFSDEPLETCEARAKILLDLYLNTPDKRANKTPLHFASEAGLVEIVEILVSYPECQKNIRTKHKELPRDVICERVTAPSAELKSRIRCLLDGEYYVPVVRAEDNSLQPRIGEPFSPDMTLPTSPDPLSPKLEIHAYAGPMEKVCAENFHKKWKTPPRTSEMRAMKSFQLSDHQKGLEVVGRSLAQEENVPWAEYWTFLDTFVNLSSTEGLNLFESFLKENLLKKFSFSRIMSSAELDHDLSQTTTPITELCNAIERLNLESNKQRQSPKSNHSVLKVVRTRRLKDAYKMIESVCSPYHSPFLLVEKSCQLFANKISRDISRLLSDTSSLDNLETESKKLRSLMTSYLDDQRFVCVDLRLVHSRIASLILANLDDQLTDEIKLENMNASIDKLIDKYSKSEDCFSSDIEENTNGHVISPKIEGKRSSHSSQIVCLLKNLQNLLLKYDCDSKIKKSNPTTEDDCLKAWSVLLPCSCVWSLNSFRGSKRASIRKSMKLALNPDIGCENWPKFGPKKLSFEECQDENIHTAVFKDDYSSDEYETATSSISSSEDENTSFVDPDDDLDVFIEGNEPTKTDYDAYLALKNTRIDRNIYPNIYAWRLAVTSFPECDRKRWPKTNNVKRCIAETTTHSASKLGSPRPPLESPTLSPKWLQVTGPYSPRRGLKCRRLF